MNERLRLPHFWKDMGYCAKAGYLVASAQCRTFEEACSLLNHMRRGKIVAPPRNVTVPRLPYKDSE
jgi:hypothetical protein